MTDLNQTAKRIVDQATTEGCPIEDCPTCEAEARSAAARALGRRGGLKGGRARADSMTPEQRKAAAQHAARVRWGIAFAEVESIHRAVPTKATYPWRVFTAHRVTKTGACRFCSRRMELGEICTLTMNPRGAVCTDCRPILCTVEQLGLDLPRYPDPYLWRPKRTW